jgi:hypothetical protein
MLEKNGPFNGDYQLFALWPAAAYYIMDPKD